MRALLILPAYNEEETILSTVRQIQDAEMPPELEVDYVVINDGSADATERICREHYIRCISLVQNLGIGGAVQTGYLYAALEGYDIAVQFDGDGQHDIRSLGALTAPILSGECDFTVGSRFLDDSSTFRSSVFRRIGINYLSLLIRLLTGHKIADVTSGYRAAGRRALEQLARSYPVDYPEPESLVQLFKQGLRVREVPVNMFQRSGGRSSISPLRSVYYMFKVTLAILCAAMHRETPVPLVEGGGNAS